MGILTDDMKRVVRQQRLGFIATVCPDGSPNLSPKGTTTVWDDDHLVFADLGSPVTIENLEHNPACEINGPGSGAGLKIRLGADVRIAAPQARLSMRFVRVGVMPELAST